MGSPSNNKTCFLLFNSFILIAGIWMLITGARLQDTPEFNLFLPRVYDLYAFQAFLLFGLSCTVVSLFAYLVMCCCSNECFSCIFVITLIHAGFVTMAIYPLLKDYEKIQDALDGNINALEGAGGTALINFGKNAIHEFSRKG